VARWGTRAIFAGALVYSASIGLLITQVQLAGADLQPTRLIPVLIVVGAGQGLIMTPLLNLVLGFIDEARAGMASGIISTVQQIGAALGVAVVGMLFSATLANSAEPSTQAGQYASAFVNAMIYNLGAAVLVCVLLLLLAKTQRPLN
jgi:sugar phosphate permease